MIVCTKCGHENQDGDDFCGNCGAYLEWEGEAVSPGEQEEPPPDATTEGDDIGTNGGAEHAPSVDEATERDRGQGQTTEDKGTAHGAVKPGPTQRRRKQRRPKPTRDRGIRPGDLICGRCGSGNPPQRHFCRRCGHPLEDAEPARRPPWWRRLRREPRTYQPGERPMRRSGRGRDARGAVRGGRRVVSGARRAVGRVVALAALLGVVGLGVGLGTGTLSLGALLSPVRGAYDWVLERLPVGGLEPVVPASAEATSSLEGHPPRHLIDLASNTWWASTGGDDGIGETLFIDLGAPVDVAAIGILSGAADPDEFTAQPRPRHLHVLFDNGVSEVLALENSHEFQSFRIRGADGVQHVEIRVIDVWRGQEGSNLSITQIEFRTRG